jgi:hypothetical protein
MTTAGTSDAVLGRAWICGTRYALTQRDVIKNIDTDGLAAV